MNPNHRLTWTATPTTIAPAVLAAAVGLSAAAPDAGGARRTTGASRTAIAFTVRLRADSPYAMDADGARQRALLPNETAEAYQPVISPDGRRVAFASTRDGDADIYVMGLDGSSPVKLTDNVAVNFDPAWSRDGRLSFSSNRAGNFDVYVMSGDGSDQSRVTSSPGSDENPSWSSDGTRLAFWSDRDGNSEIYTIGVDGSGEARLTNDGAEDLFPSWSPDGRRIAFSSERDGDPEIYVRAYDKP